MYIFLCEDTFDGIFTGIYHAWESGYGHQNIKIQAQDSRNYELFAEYISIETIEEKSQKVANTLKKRFGNEAFKNICQAVLSDDLDKAEVIYRVIIFGLTLKNGKELMNCLTNDYVCRLFQLSRNVSNEAHHYLGFLRFQLLKSGILFSAIQPKNHILTVIASHFAERLPNENWLIYDENRKEALIHKKNYVPIIVSAESLNLDLTKDLSEDEMDIQRLWKAFFNSIAIKERKNLKLQQQNLPKRFRGHMFEFD